MPRSRPTWFLRTVLLLLGLLAVTACDGAESRSMVAVESPNALEIELGQAQFEEGSQRSITVVDPSRRGRPMVSPERVTWSTSNASVATVENGALHARGIGQARITASSGSTHSSVSVSVVRTPSELVIGQEGSFEGEVGQTLDWPLEAKVVNTHGRPIEGVEVRFKVKSGSGVVSPVIVSTDADGMARSEWTLGGTAGEQTVEVEALDTQVQAHTVVAAASPGPAHQILVTPAEVTLRPGSAFQFEADVVDVFGNVVGDTEVNWRSTNPDIAAIAGDGWVTGLQSGQASVEAEPVAGSSSEAQAMIAELSASATRGNGNAHVKVQTVEGESDAVIAVMGGNHQTGRVGETLPLSLEIQATDAAGRPLRQTDVSWVLDYGVGALSATSGRTDGQGRASVSLSLGTSPGQLKVTADLGDLGSAAFFATAEAGSLVEIRVSPDSASVEVGAEHSFEIAAFDEYGNPLSDHPAPVWSVADQAIATVSSAGRAHGQSAGRTGVRASIEGVTDDAQIQVNGTSDGGDDSGDTGGTDDTGDTGGTDDSGDTGGTDDGTTGGTDSGGDDGTQTVTDPAEVTDLEVTGTTENTATVRFTQVDDGTGAPAQYHVRWHLHPIEWGWGQATPASGSCEDPIAGDQIGASRTCTVEGLNPATEYDFQLVAFRVQDGSRVFSPLSNVATGMTASSSDDSGSGDDGTTVTSLEAAQESVSFSALEETVTLSAEALDETGQPVSGVSTEWTSSNQGVATVNQSGTIIAKAIGTALVVVSTTCCDTAVADTVTVSVDQVPASVTVDPSSVSLEVGASQQLVASVNDSNNYKIDGTPVTWSSSNTAVATVSSDGLVTAIQDGEALIMVASDDLQSTASLEVVADTGDSGSSQFPNQPAGFELIAESPMNDYMAEACVAGVNVEPKFSGGWHGYFANYKGYGLECGTVGQNVVINEDAPISNGYHRMLWFDGMKDGSQTAAKWYFSDRGNEVWDGEREHIYVAHTYRLTSGQGDGLWEPNANGTKDGWFAHGTAKQNDTFPRILGDGSSTPRASFRARMAQQNVVSRNLDTNIVTGDVVFVDQWHLWEFEMKLNTLGEADGIMRWWIDGVLVLEYTDVVYRTAENPRGFRGYQYEGMPGGGGEDRTRDDYIDVSHVRVMAAPQR